jgi:zinc transport system permease protein
MTEMLALEFMQRALLAGVLTALVAGYLGVFVVQRGMSFIGSGLAHAAFGGVALGLLLGREPLWVAVPFTVAVALLITWVRDRTSLSADTVIGIFFATSMALGILFISRLPTYAADAFTYLFGSILSVSWVDTAAVGALALVMLALLPLWGRWAYATVDREAARADRVPVRLDDYILSVLVAVTVVVAAKVVGIVLISAFLVIPPAAARLLSRRFLQMTVLSVALGALTAAAGLFASYALDAPSGATIILVQALVFLACAGYYIAFRKAASV